MGTNAAVRAQRTEAFLDSSLLENDLNTLQDLISRLITAFFKKAKGFEKQDWLPPTLESFPDYGDASVKSIAEILISEILGKAKYKCRSRYLAYVDNGVSVVNVIAAPVIALLQQNMTTHVSDSPGATLNELSVLRTIRHLIGYETPCGPPSIQEVGGTFVSGGMMGNMLALLQARNRLRPESQKKGVTGSPLKLVLGENISHFSFWNALGWLGMGESNIEFVETNRFRMNPEALDATLKKIAQRGEEVLMVVASLGDSSSHTIENVGPIRKICDTHKVWLHGDGANGGCLIFSDKYRHLSQEFHLCDSITLDPHKALGLNYPCSLFMCKNIDEFNSVISYWNIVNKPGSLDLGIISPFLNSRGFDSLRLWLLMKMFGIRGIGRIIDRKIDATHKVRKKLDTLGQNIIFWADTCSFGIVFEIVPQSFLFRAFTPFSLEDDRTLSNIQLACVSYLQRRYQIDVNTFQLPVSIRGEKREKDSLSQVIALHNGHEEIPDKVSDDLVQGLREFIAMYR